MAPSTMPRESPDSWRWRNPSSAPIRAADRSIVFLALTGAEPGLLGSQYYVANPLFPLSDTAAVLNLDGLRNRRTRPVI